LAVSTYWFIQIALRGVLGVN